MQVLKHVCPGRAQHTVKAMSKSLSIVTYHQQSRSALDWNHYILECLASEFTSFTYIHKYILLFFFNFFFVSGVECIVTNGEEKKDRRNKDCTAVMDTQKLYNDIHVVCTSAK